MTDTEKSSDVIALPDKPGRKISPMEAIWGKKVAAYGYAAIPSILIRGQKRLGITSLQMNIIIQLLDYWWDPARPPFPSKEELGRRIGISAKTIQNNIRALEDVGLIKRESRKTAAGDCGTNIYHMNGLVDRIRKMEPEFTKLKQERASGRREVETPVGQRSRV